MESQVQLESYLRKVEGLPLGESLSNEKKVKKSVNDLINISEKNGLSLRKLDGMNFNILSNEWRTSDDTSVNYILKLIKS